MISVEHMDELIVRFNSGEIDIRDVIEQSYIEGRVEAIDEFAENVSESIIWDILAEVMKRNIGASEGADRIIEYLQKIAKELKEQSK